LHPESTLVAGYPGRCRAIGLLALWVAGCGSAPVSRIPDAAKALSQMRESSTCSRGLQVEAKVDYFEKNRRVRGSVAVLAEVPDNIRIDVFSPFGLNLSTLTSDGSRFALYQAQERTVILGSASSCNLARFTKVSLPPFVLVQLLRGEAPVLVHTPEQASIGWNSSWLGTGHYTLEIRGKNESVEKISLVPAPGDWSLPWYQQRLRVENVTVSQGGRELYQVLLEGHAPALTAPPREDPDGLDPPILPSGPACSAEVPRRIRFISAESETDFVLSYNNVQHNPPLLPSVFRQVIPGGVRVLYSECSD
jgi:hypothetical protein